MKSSYIIIFVLVILGGIMFYKMSGDGFQKTETGLKYKVVEKGASEQQKKEGNFILMEMSYTTANGEVIYDSKNDDFPWALQYKEADFEADGGVKEAISMVEQGDKYMFKLRAKEVFGDNFRQQADKYKLKKDSPIFLNLYVKDVMDKETHKVWKEEEQKKWQKRQEEKKKKAKEEAKVQLEKDIEAIDAYLKENNIEAKSTASGLRYVIDQAGKGSKPKEGDKVKINYLGKTLEGTVFDTNLKATAKEHQVYNEKRTYEAFEFSVGKRNVIAGMDEGLMLLTKGSKARLFIPSGLAYGINGGGEKIKPNEILIFEIELLEIETPKAKK